MVEPAIKRCSSCGRGLSLSDFHRCRRNRDGLQGRCKACQRDAINLSRARHPETLREHARLRKERHGAKDVARTAEWKRNNPEKVAANTAVSNAIRLGHLVRPKCCSQCGSERFAIQAHHEDYTAQLDVVWLCAPCHGILHHRAGSW